MAFYVAVTKIEESAVSARYRFETASDRVGLFEINKTTGDVVLLEPMAGDENEHCFNRAAVKVLRGWREGQLPEFTEWAS